MTEPTLSSLLERAADRARVGTPPIEQMVARTTRRRRRNATLLAGCCAAVVAAVVGIGTFVAPSSNPDTPPAAGSPTPGSTPGNSPTPNSPLLGPANENLAVGETAELRLFLHCGLQYARIDGTAWQTDPRGNGSVPDGWPELLIGTATRTAVDTVEFSSPGVVDHLVFHPTDDLSALDCF